ncbi:MAG: fluoride efflux transporter CrcB [Pirellulales bacterium]|nr:fluoride efflux transporter CrcB [Pirellulales bacterium]
MAHKLIWMALAGALGTLLRYWLAGVVQNAVGTLFPWGTAVVNLTGCLLFGLLVAVLEGRFAFSGETRIVLLTGFMGAFTTFSTFAFETEQLLESSEWALAAGNLTLQNLVGLVALFLGLTLGRLI